MDVSLIKFEIFRLMWSKNLKQILTSTTLNTILWSFYGTSNIIDYLIMFKLSVDVSLEITNYISTIHKEQQTMLKLKYCLMNDRSNND